MSVADEHADAAYWIASYPKSGNTWMRLFLETYRHNPDQPLPINNLPSGTAAYSRKLLDDLLGVETADFPPDFLTDLRPRCYDLMAGEDGFRYIKTHECYTETASGEPVFSANSSGGAVLIVRNPLDVVISLSHFLHLSVWEAIEHLDGPKRPSHHMLTGLIPHDTGSWSSFAQSWLNGTLRLHVVRYEDMLSTPESVFAGVVRFMGLPVDQERLQKSIAFTRFDRLKEQEEKTGFAAMQTGAKSFFRMGQKGLWRDQLKQEHIEAVLSKHQEMMQYFGYFPLPYFE